jgi:Tol biopolymer transport system component
MKHSTRIAILFAGALIGFAQTKSPVAGQELSAEAKSKEQAEARAKRNAQIFENGATTLVFYDRYGKRTGQIGERGLYNQVLMSPDGKRIAVTKRDLEDENTDLWVLDAATGAATRITKSARTEFVFSPIWSPDSRRVAYVTIRAGQEAAYSRDAGGGGEEELLYKHPGAGMNLSDWSTDGRSLAFAISDLKGGTLYTLSLQGSGERTPTQIYRSASRIFGARFSPDGRFLAYAVIDNNANKGEVFVRPVDPAADAAEWQISDGALSPPFWRNDGKELYYLARDQSIMSAEVSTSPNFTFTKPKVLFRQQGPVPDRMAGISADGQRFIALPPPRGPQVQQITIFNREGQVLKKIGEPGLYSQPAFSPDAKRLLVVKNDINKGQQDLWTIDLASGKSAQVTNDALIKVNPMWSPDGKHILYSSMRNGDWGVYRRASDGTGNEELLFQYTPGAFLGITDISRDGGTLICDGGIILPVPLTGSDARARKEIETLREEFFDDLGRLSPDGRFMAYRSDEAKPERFEVYVRPYDSSKGTVGEQKWQISKDGVQAMLHWREDGKEIFFRGQDLSSTDMVVMSAEVTPTPVFKASPPKVLFRIPGPLAGNLGNISRDGQQFVFAINVPAVNATK